MRILTTRYWAILIGVVYLATPILRAELIFQPLKTESDERWRAAGSSLLDGLARIFDALAAFERRDSSSGRRDLESAFASLNNAAKDYEQLAKSGKQGQTMSIDGLPGAEQERIRQAFAHYGISPPADERGAAQLAGDEVKKLQNALAKLSNQIAKSDVKAVQELLVAVTRLERVGTNTALLAKLAAQKER